MKIDITPNGALDVTPTGHDGFIILVLKDGRVVTVSEEANHIWWNGQDAGAFLRMLDQEATP